MNSHNLISKGGYRFTAQHCTNINNNARFTPTPLKNTSYRIQEMYLKREV